MKDYLVTIHLPYAIVARDDDQAEERAQRLEALVAAAAALIGTRKDLEHPPWLGASDMIEHEVEEA